ncbi:hypothetical protein D3C75_1240360 [compost metagenome]
MQRNLQITYMPRDHQLILNRLIGRVKNHIKQIDSIAADLDSLRMIGGFIKFPVQAFPGMALQISKQLGGFHGVPFLMLTFFSSLP